jgi:hypothetical protein
VAMAINVFRSMVPSPPKSDVLERGDTSDES